MGKDSGCIYVETKTSNLTIKDSFFFNNKATYLGGAISLVTSESAQIHFIRTKFVNNTSDDTGGAITIRMVGENADQFS